MSSSKEIDPLLKDLSERKQSFRQDVVMLVEELKEVRNHLDSQEQSFVRENITRQEAEMRVTDMEEEIHRLHKNLDERNGQYQEATSTAEKIPTHLPVTIACHNAGKCWSPSLDDRMSVPFSDYPNLSVVYPPFPEATSFGQDDKKLGIACHHPKLIVLQREDNIRVIITSANLVPKQVISAVTYQIIPADSLYAKIPLAAVRSINQHKVFLFIVKFTSYLVVTCESILVFDVTCSFTGFIYKEFT